MFPSVFWRVDSGHLLPIAYFPRLSSLLSFLVPSFVFICVWARREPQWSHRGRVVVASLSHGGRTVVTRWCLHNVLEFSHSGLVVLVQWSRGGRTVLRWCLCRGAVSSVLCMFCAGRFLKFQVLFLCFRHE